ncbi:hypothetical protein JCM10450v2_004094 [Rhodotorula kratochvilovae]
MAARSDNPSDSHYACNKSRGVCTWACNSGFEVQGEVCSQTCTASADCKNAIPANSNRYCSGGFCSWPSSATCRVSSDCANVVPGNSNRYCNGGGCRSGYVANRRKLQEYNVDLGLHDDVDDISAGEQLFLVSVHLVFLDLVFFDLVFFDLDLLNLDHHNLDLLNLVLLDLVLHNLVFHNFADCNYFTPADTHNYCDAGFYSWRCNDGYVLGYGGRGCTEQNSTLTAAATSPAATPTVLRSYEGATFFDRWNYLNKSDPTQGSVIYVSREFTEEKGLTYISPVGTAILQIDREPTLSPGNYRPSVRISSSDTYEPGHLILLDMKHAPHSPSVWPAFWMYNDPWADVGKIDVYKGINERTFGQMSLCNMNGGNMRKSCSINDGSAGFNGECGGVFAVPYAETGISIWRWKRSDIPLDILIGVPRWTGWGTLVATWEGSMCDTRTYFKRQMLTFDITTCGTWAVSTSTWNNVASSGPVAAQYATCAQAVQDPAAFDEAYFEINYLPVYTV